jgi:hypothetical protein
MKVHRRLLTGSNNQLKICHRKFKKIQNQRDKPPLKASKSIW